MFKLCAKLILLATLATITVQDDPKVDPKCPNLDDNAAKNFKFTDHKGLYYVTKDTHKTNDKVLTCISFNIESPEPNDNLVRTTYKAYDKGDDTQIITNGNITWTNNQAIVNWQKDDNSTIRKAYILDFDDNVILWYSCHEVKENDTAPVTSLEQYAGIMTRNFTAADRTQEFADKLYNLVSLNVTSVDVDMCSGSAQTVLSLSLGVIALLYCLISTGTTV